MYIKGESEVDEMAQLNKARITVEVSLHAFARFCLHLVVLIGVMNRFRLCTVNGNVGDPFGLTIKRSY